MTALIVAYVFSFFFLVKSLYIFIYYLFILHIIIDMFATPNFVLLGEILLELKL